MPGAAERSFVCYNAGMTRALHPRHNRFMTLAVTTAFICLLAPHVFAESTDDVVAPTEKPRISATRCTIAKGRITNAAATLQSVTGRQATVYTNIRERLNARLAVLQSKGYDTKDLQASSQTLNSQINDFTAKAQALHTTLTTVQDAACGDSDSDFTSALSSARTQLAQVRAASDSVNKTVRTTLVPQIKAAATWLTQHGH